MEEQLRGPRHSRLSRIDCRDAGAARRRDAVKAAAPSKRRGSPEFTCALPACVQQSASLDSRESARAFSTRFPRLFARWRRYALPIGPIDRPKKRSSPESLESRVSQRELRGVQRKRHPPLPHGYSRLDIRCGGSLNFPAN